MQQTKPKREYVEQLPRTASFVQNDNKHANTFVHFREPERLEYFTVTGDKAQEPNVIIKETFLQEH